jgi:hypothetical protein
MQDYGYLGYVTRRRVLGHTPRDHIGGDSGDGTGFGPPALIRVLEYVAMITREITAAVDLEHILGDGIGQDADPWLR